MKLELKHIAPYLPYGVKYLNTHEDFIEKEGIIHIDSIGSILKYEFLKPILRPLSDLTEEIEVNGEKFVPRNKMGLIHDVSGNNILNYRTGERIDILSLPYYQIQYLFKWHFDVFGLIPQGLAIDINTIEK